MTSRALLRSIAVLLSVLATATPAAASSPVHTPLAAHIARRATLEDGGQRVAVTVAVTCPAGSEVVEAFLYASQDGNTSNFAAIPVTCDSTPHAAVVHAGASDMPFHEGRARASGYVLLGSGESVSPTRTVNLKNA